VAVVLVALALAALLVATVVSGLRDGRGEGEIAPWTRAPAAVPAPAGLVVPEPAEPAVVAAAPPVRAVSAAKVRRALAPLLGNKRLGRHVEVAVAGLQDGDVVFRRGTGAMVPASTMKLLTGAAALEVLGPDHRFPTTTVSADRGGTVVLVGGGDPFLEAAPPPAGTYPEPADLRTLARMTAKELRSADRRSVRLRYDSSLFTGPDASPRWERSYLVDVVSPISSLWVDQGGKHAAARDVNAPAEAARAFAEALERTGIEVRGRPSPGKAPGQGDGDELAAGRSAPVEQIVARTLEVSDNEAAEVLFRHVALGEGQPASFAGGSRAVRAVLSRLGVETPGALIYDGSGLSRDNRISADSLLSLLVLAGSEDGDHLRPLLTGLPVAGFTGSLAYRFQTGDDDGLGAVRAKTGTLTGVHGLAGVATDRGGTPLAFVAVADRVPLRHNWTARTLVDEMAAALAGCSCGQPAGAGPSP
jgi:D-alanyl-D-alanine carboxypeptidase/D-alanyl-D-alanine-endopeptidase (penicillin-binding protein 4)